MLDGSETVSDWPLLNALLNTASGSPGFDPHGGWVGIGFSQQPDVVVSDGTDYAARRVTRPVERPRQRRMRHADAGYEIARDCAMEQGLKLPGITV